MHRFFLSPSAIQQNAIVFPAETAHQILRVLRLRPSEQVVVLDNLGQQYLVELVELTRDQVSGRILSQTAAGGEPPVSLSLYLCLTQREKFEWMLQKCTEVGAEEFTPVLSSRSLVQDLTALQNKNLRWQRILQEAAEQSGRGRIPNLHPPAEFAVAAAVAPAHHDLCLIAWEEADSLTLAHALEGVTSLSRIAILIGPEGGLTREEVDLAVQAGWQSVTLGPRIMRMETAAIVAAALTIDHFENHAG